MRRKLDVEYSILSVIALCFVDEKHLSFSSSVSTLNLAACAGGD